MDLAKELKELREAVRAAKADGRITLREAVIIGREAADVIAIVLPLIIGECAALAEQVGGDCEASREKSDQEQAEMPAPREGGFKASE